ncbi:MAG: hypothetical protein OXD49_21930, partial [Candidatus Poribacteria bacterium]|nr:hypothetical protein [Candidatus Poribacteria bacterium]
MKTFCLISYLLLFALSQQVVYAQQPPVAESKTEPTGGFVKLGMPLEDVLTKITFVIIWLSGDGSDEIVFEGEGVTRQKDYIELSEHENSWYRLLSKYAVESNRYIFV